MEDVDQFIAIIMSSRSYCFTRFFDNVGMAEDWITNTFSEHDAVNYAVAQIEEAPTTLHLHAQGFMQLKQGRTMNWCKSNIPYIGQTSHLERRMGTADEARKYCMKEDTRVFPPKEIGRWTTQGQRSDLTTYAHRIKELALQGMKLPAVNRILADEMPGVHLRFRKNAQELLKISRPTRSTTSSHTHGKKTLWTFSRSVNPCNHLHAAPHQISCIGRSRQAHHPLGV